MNLQTPYRYELDKTGVDPNNLVVDELHDLPNLAIRCVAPTYGGFFTESVVVKDYITGTELIHGVDYKFGEILDIPSAQCAKEICSYIAIFNASLTKITITYQALGGNYSYSMDSVIEMLNSLDLGNRPVEWGLIVGRPIEFPPESHIHPSSDIYGMEYVVNSLERVRQAILMGDVASHDEIYAYIDKSGDELKDIISGVLSELRAHTASNSNPHNVTKAQVGLGSVENYAVATKAEAEAGTSNVKYMTPLRVFEAIDVKLIPVNQHIADRNNPHAVTKAQVGLGSVQNYGIATKADAETGTNNALYMTPLRVKEAITAQAGTALNAHIADKANPHAVTKAQVGLGSVENYGIAAQSEATTGTSNVKYMTPLRVKEAITAQAVAPLNSHISNTNNPHAVSKAQVGLGSVQNYGIATKVEAEAGTSHALYMTPLRVKEAITSQVGSKIDTHIANTNNPHAVTKAQVGLGSVQNYAVATKVEAEAGTSQNTYMTPQRTLESIMKNAITSPNFTTDVTTTGSFKATAGFTFMASPAATGMVWAGSGTTGQFDLMVNGVRAVRYGTEEATHSGINAFVGAAPQVGGNTAGPLVTRSTGTGDANAAGLVFQANNTYGKITMNSSGQYAFGGGFSNANIMTLSATGNLTTVGDVAAFSDPRLKKDMKEIHNALDVVRCLRGYGFSWRDDIDLIAPKAGKHDYGFNAHEVRDLVPELTAIDSSGYVTVAYAKVIPFLTNAISTLEERIRSLESSQQKHQINPYK